MRTWAASQVEHIEIILPAAIAIFIIGALIAKTRDK